MGMEPKFVSVRTAAKMLGKKVRTIRDWIYKGKIDAVKSSNGYRWMIFLDEVNRILGEDAEVENAD